MHWSAVRPLYTLSIYATIEMFPVEQSPRVKLHHRLQNVVCDGEDTGQGHGPSNVSHPLQLGWPRKLRLFHLKMASIYCNHLKLKCVKTRDVKFKNMKFMFQNFQVTSCELKFGSASIVWEIRQIIEKIIHQSQQIHLIF